MKTITRFFAILVMLAVSVWSLQPAYAATLTVQSAADDGTPVPGNCPGAGCRLRDAIAAAAPGDTITFDGDYTIRLASQLTIGKNLTIDGAGHNVTVTGENAGRVFQVNAGFTVNLQNLTVANGLAGSDGRDGGGLWVNGANGQVTTVNINHVTFSGNRSTNEGGLGGGGLSSYNGTLSLTDVTFINNEAVTGGGLSNTYGSTTLLNVTFDGNRATQSLPDEPGCGALLSGMSNLTITNATFRGNTAQIGGALCKMMGSATLINVTFSGNQATQAGGAIANSSTGFGGPLTIVNNILWGNTAPLNAQIYDLFNTALVTYSDVQGGWPGAGNIDLNPLLGALGNYGGDTQTIPLLPGSSAIDAGDDASCPAADQRGVSRPQPAGGACDIGAYEAGPPILRVSKAGSGMGTVTSDPTGINCGADCAEWYYEDTPVTLTATPDTGSVFAGWSGDCSGTNPTTTVTMDADKTCTATFNLWTPPVPVGGYLVPVNRVELLAPWLGLVGLASLGALTVALVRRRRR